MTGKRVVIVGWAGSVHVQRWARGLIEKGYRVRVISPGDEPIEGVETVVFPRKGRWSYLRYLSAAVNEAKSFQPDLIHVHYAGGPGLWAVRTRIHPLVVSVWGTDILQSPSSWLNRMAVRRVLKGADHITSTSRMLKAATRKLLGNVDKEISVIPFGVNPVESCPPLPPAEPTRICFVKNHKPVYGPQLLLQAMVKVKEAVPDIVLTMAGEGALTEKLKRMTAELGLAANVEFVGFVDNNKIDSFIARHHFMVMPSLEEAFGVAALEASACGRPVIASNVGGVPEVLVDGKTGILVPKGDVDTLAAAIVRLAQNADLAEQMGRAGYEFVKGNFTWDKSLTMMAELYEQLINEHRQA